MVNQVMDDAVIAVDIHGVVQIYSKRAQGLFKYPVDDAVGEKNIECFEVIGFEHVLSTKNPIKDRLIEVGGMNLIVTVNPIYHGKKLYGAIAMIREFQEEEIKQHSFRKQIMDKGHRSKYRFEDLIGKSRVLTELKEVAERMSKSDSSVLIYGESGTGKELIAQAMHFTSHRSHYQFVALNCGALPESLLESELFGYEEGAFTGARKGGKQGLFELAHQGTLFLDEIGEMPMNTQLRLLRVLQEREVMRIGGDRLIKIDVRIIAASNKMLKRLVAEGKFREDLYYRLCVLPLKIPSLKERREDVDALIHHFKLKNDTDFEFSEGAKRCLELYHWPGNIRELRNYVEYWKNLNKPVVAELDLPFYEDFELNSVEGHKEEGFQRYLEHVHHPVEMSITVLDILRTHKMNDQRIGRKGIYKKVNELGRVLSEHEVRFILLQMESFDYVKICRGRGGTVITPLGAQALDCFKQSRLTCG